MWDTTVLLKRGTMVVGINLQVLSSYATNSIYTYFKSLDCIRVNLRESKFQIFISRRTPRPPTQQAWFHQVLGIVYPITGLLHTQSALHASVYCPVKVPPPQQKNSLWNTGDHQCLNANTVDMYKDLLMEVNSPQQEMCLSVTDDAVVLYSSWGKIFTKGRYIALGIYFCSNLISPNTLVWVIEVVGGVCITSWWHEVLKLNGCKHGHCPSSCHLASSIACFSDKL